MWIRQPSTSTYRGEGNPAVLERSSGVGKPPPPCISKISTENPSRRGDRDRAGRPTSVCDRSTVRGSSRFAAHQLFAWPVGHAGHQNPSTALSAVGQMRAGQNRRLSGAATNQRGRLSSTTARRRGPLQCGPALTADRFRIAGRGPVAGKTLVAYARAPPAGPARSQAPAQVRPMVGPAAVRLDTNRSGRHSL